LERQGVFVDCRSDECAGASGSAGCAGELLWAGVFEERVGFDVCFGPEFLRRELVLMSAFLRLGLRLWRKVEGFWKW